MTVVRLAWDSVHFGFEVARITLHDRSELDDALEQCRADGVRVAYLDVIVADEPSFDTCIGAGFRLAETKVELRSDRPATAWELPAGVEIRIPTADELGAVERIAGTVEFPTRFFLDPEFPRAAARRLYVEWVRRARARTEDDVLAAFVDGEVAGFTTMSTGDGTLGVHELAAVDPARTVRGLGRALYGITVDRLRARGCSSISGTTQLRNLPAIRTLEALGYCTAGARHTLHRWFDA